MKNPFDSIKEPEMGKRPNFQFYEKNYPKFYCHDVCGVKYEKQCKEQCFDCMAIVGETRAKKRDTKDKI